MIRPRGAIVLLTATLAGAGGILIWAVRGETQRADLFLNFGVAMVELAVALLIIDLVLESLYEKDRARGTFFPLQRLSQVAGDSCGKLEQTLAAVFKSDEDLRNALVAARGSGIRFGETALAANVRPLSKSQIRDVIEYVKERREKCLPDLRLIAQLLPISRTQDLEDLFNEERVGQQQIEAHASARVTKGATGPHGQLSVLAALYRSLHVWRQIQNELGVLRRQVEARSAWERVLRWLRLLFKKMTGERG